jgi:hypothetical protein
MSINLAARSLSPTHAMFSFSSFQSRFTWIDLRTMYYYERVKATRAKQFSQGDQCFAGILQKKGFFGERVREELERLEGKIRFAECVKTENQN